MTTICPFVISFQLKCIARVHDIYGESAEKLVEEEVPNVNVLASGTSSHGMNSYQAYDQPQDGELSDQNGLYLTHQKGKHDNLFLPIALQRINFRFDAMIIMTYVCGSVFYNPQATTGYIPIFRISIYNFICRMI